MPKPRVAFAIRYTPTQDESSWKTLDQIRKELPPGKWRHSRLYEDVGAAIEGGLSPTSFWALNEQDQAYLIAYHRVKGMMMAWENHLHDKEMDRQRRQNRSK